MRREHKLEQSYIDWLKSLGCIIYLPLSTQGDLNDRISGLDMQLTGNGGFTWDSNKQMYLATQPSTTGQYYGVLRNGMDENAFPTNEYGVCLTMLRNTTYGVVDFLHHNPASTNYAMQPIYANNGNISTFPSSMTYIARTWDTNTCLHFRQGTLYSTTTTATTLYPSNWGFDSNNLGVFFGFAGMTSMRNTSYWIKEIYVFNKKLNLETVRMIQGYE